MKKKSASQSAFFNLRVLIGLFVFLAGVFLALLGSGAFSNLFAQPKAAKQAQPRSGPPDVVRMVGPVSHNKDLRSLPYMAPSPEIEKGVLTRYPRGKTPLPQQQDSSPPIIKRLLQPPPTMPAPVLTFDGMNSAQSGCNCLPPDSDGDVGPNHYVNAVNSSIKIFDKVGNPLNGVNGITFNSFFAPLGGGQPLRCGPEPRRPFCFL